jgi:acyl-CoA synthetase (AMP-forming)/AMP-acid ligase II
MVVENQMIFQKLCRHQVGFMADLKLKNALLYPHPTALVYEDFINFCKENITRYKAPKSVEFMKELPKNAIDKILKREMKDKYWVDK